MSSSNYGKIERGELGFDLERLVTLGAKWRVTVSDFYHGVEDPPDQMANYFERNRIRKDIERMLKNADDIDTLRIIEHLLKKDVAKKQTRS